MNFSFSQKLTECSLKTTEYSSLQYNSKTCLLFVSNQKLKMMRIILLVLLLFCCASVKAQQTVVSTGKLPLGIQVTNAEGGLLDISKFCEGFDRDGLPINLVIPHNTIIKFFLPTLTEENGREYAFLRGSSSRNLDNFNFDYEGRKVAFLGAISHSPNSNSSISAFYNGKTFTEKNALELVTFRYRIDYAPTEFKEVFLASEMSELLKESYGKDIFDLSSRYYKAWKEKGYTKSDGREIPDDIVLPQHENTLFINVTHNYDINKLILERNGTVIDLEDPYALLNWVITLPNLEPGDYSLSIINEEKVYGQRIDTIKFTIKDNFWATWGAWLIAAFAVLIIAFLVYRISTKRKLKESNLLKQLSEAELKAIRSQLNPHFLFNALNAIQNLVNKEDTERANDYIVKLSRLMRMVLSQSDESLHAIHKEVELSKLYLELENMRAPFEFDFQIDNGLNPNTLVPAMILQPYLENAVLHGVGNWHATQINVRIFERSGYLILEVKDNGKPDSTLITEGRGMHLGRERIEIIKDQLGNDAQVGVKCRNSSEEGFQVTIQLPTNL